MKRVEITFLHNRPFCFFASSPHRCVHDRGPGPERRRSGGDPCAGFGVERMVAWLHTALLAAWGLIREGLEGACSATTHMRHVTCDGRWRRRREGWQKGNGGGRARARGLVRSGYRQGAAEVPGLPSSGRDSPAQRCTVTCSTVQYRTVPYRPYLGTGMKFVLSRTIQ